jgi:hypothetical protein
VIGGEHVAEGGKRAVEARVPEGQVLSVALDPVDLHPLLRRPPAGDLQQLGLEVEPGHASAFANRGEGGVSSAARDVEHIHLRFHAGALHAGFTGVGDPVGDGRVVAGAPHCLGIQTESEHGGYPHCGQVPRLATCRAWTR